MATIAGLAFSAVLDRTGAVNVVRVTDVTPYGAGIANNITGVLTITQPDGLTYNGTFVTPDIYYYSGALFVAQKELRLANDGNFQKGVYTIQYTVHHPSYDPTTVTQSFTINYTRPVGVLTPTLDVFTPSLKINDVTNYVISNFGLQGVTRAWTATSTPGMTVGGNSPQFDLNINGHYYDAVYSISMTAKMTYLLTAASNISIIDTITDTATLSTIIPNSLNTLFAAITAYKNALGVVGATCKTDYIHKQTNYMYAYILFTNFLERGTCGDKSDLLKLYTELKSVLNNNASLAYTQTNAIIPTYNFGAFCGRGQTSLPLQITSQPQSLTKNTGESAIFTVAASGTPTLTYQWRKNGVNISGATSASYTIGSVGSGDAANYDVLVTDGLSNYIVSSVASLTVNTPAPDFTAYWGWFASDPYTALQTSDTLTYQANATIPSGSPIAAYFGSAPNLQYLVLKVPVAEPIKTVYYNDSLINGNIPDAAWQAPFVTGGFRYYVTRQTVTFDPGATTIFS